MNDQAAFLTSIFGDMPGWSPNNVVNPSGTCATTKLMQCRNFGVYECEVSAKFERGPENLQDLSKDDFLARKKVVDAVEKWNEQRNKYETYHLILYDYEIVKGSTKRVRDRGHLIFIDLTTSRFLLVMCFDDSSDAHKPNVSYEEDYAKLTKANANRFVSLAKYLYHDGNRPHFVHATYTTPKQGLHPDFLGTLEPPTDPNVPIFHVTSANFSPSLLPGEVERIDNVLTGSHKKLPPSELKAQVMGKKENRPDMSNFAFANEKYPTACSNCGTPGTGSMPTCGRCKLVRYCNKECQVAAWQYHKAVCKAAPKPSS